MPAPIEVRKVPLHNVSDASELAKLIDDGVMEADRVIAVIGKTEGNGGVNDYTRIIADRAFREVLVEKGTPVEGGGQADPDRVVRRHRRRHQPARDDLRHAARGRGREDRRAAADRRLRDERACCCPRTSAASRWSRRSPTGVKRAMDEAGITDPADVHYVQTKTPLLDHRHDPRRARAAGKTTSLEEPHGSMDVSNGTTALGIAVALGEIEMPTQEQIMRDLSLFSSVASCSSGVELDQAQIVVVGNARGIGGRYRIGHCVMKDALDQDGIWEAIRNAGLDLPERPHYTDLGDRLVNVFLKCEADPTGQVRGRRNIMLDDSDVSWHRQIKATRRRRRPRR